MAGAALWLILVTPATAQQSASSPSASISAQDLAQSVHNPFEDFVKVLIEADINFRLGLKHNTGLDLNLEPLFPVRIRNQWDPIGANETVTYLPSPHEQFGLNDLQTSFFLTPHGASEWIWGLGPIFEFPTATAKQMAPADGLPARPELLSWMPARGPTLPHVDHSPSPCRDITPQTI